MSADPEGKVSPPRGAAAGAARRAPPPRSRRPSAPRRGIAHGRHHGGGSPPPPPTPAPPPPAAARPGAATGFDPGDAMWQAVGARDFTEVDRLLRRGADPNMVCPDGWVTEAARPRDGSIGRSLLHHAAWAGDLNVFKLIVAAGGDVGRQRNTAWRPNGGVRGRGATPLHHAVMYGREDIVAYLVDEEGADINAPGEQGYTALHLAAKFNYPRLVHYLLERGARTDMLTRDEKTARELAGAKQERSHAQMGHMLETFDRYDADAKSRQKLLPGAPLPPDPRLAAAPEPSPAPASWTAGRRRRARRCTRTEAAVAAQTTSRCSGAGAAARRTPRPASSRAARSRRCASSASAPAAGPRSPTRLSIPPTPCPGPTSHLLQKPPKLTPEHHAATHQGSAPSRSRTRPPRSSLPKCGRTRRPTRRRR